jgi:hypothetical protein
VLPDRLVRYCTATTTGQAAAAKRSAQYPTALAEE